jgi:hypothetical protein
MTIRVFDVVGELCMTYEDGEKLHNLLVEALSRNDHVELDFSRTRIFVTAFFNASIGPLLKDSPKQQLLNKLSFVNIPAAGAEPLRHSIENAERYYKDPNFHKTLDKVLEDISKGK